MMTATEIIQALGGFRTVSAALGLPYTTVHAWARHDSIPQWRWPDVLGMAAKSGLSLDAGSRPANRSSDTPAKRARPTEQANAA